MLIVEGVNKLPSDLPRITLRLDEKTHYKIKYIADDNFRPLNSELTMLVLQRIKEYEAEHGEIKVEEEG